MSLIESRHFSEHPLASLLMAAVVATCVPGVVSGEVLPGETVALAESGLLIDSPRIASHRFVTAIAWIESQSEGSNWVRLATLKDGVIPPASVAPLSRIISPLTAANNSDVSIAINPVILQPSAAWVSTEDGQHRLLYSDRGRSTEEVANSASLLDPPSLCFDASGTAYLAWPEISGGSSELQIATRTDAGWSRIKLSQGARPYDVAPQLLRSAQGVEAYWFSIQGGASSCMLATIDRAGEVNALAPLVLGGVPANRLPTLFLAQPDDRLGALWLEQRADGEVFLILDPREEGATAPLVIGSSGAVTEQAGISGEGSGSIVWLQGSGPDRFLAASSREFGSFARPVSPDAHDPVVSASDNWLHLLFVDPAQEGAKGTLWYWRVR